MSETEQDPPPPEEEAPPAPAPEDAAPPGSDVPAPPEPEPEPELEPGDQAPPPPSGEEAEQEEAGVTSAGEAVSGEDAIPLEKDRSPSASDILNLIPSDGNIVLPDDDEPDLQRSRSRPAPRMVQSVLSEILSQGSLRSSKYRRSMSGMPNLQETLKEKQVLLIRFSIHVTFISNEIFW